METPNVLDFKSFDETAVLIYGSVSSTLPPGSPNEPCEVDSKIWFVKSEPASPVRDATDVHQHSGGLELEREPSLKMLTKRQVCSGGRELEEERTISLSDLTKESDEVDSNTELIKTEPSSPVRDTTEPDQHPTEPDQHPTEPDQHPTQPDQDPGGLQSECEPSLRMLIKLLTEASSAQHVEEHEEESPPDECGFGVCSKRRLESDVTAVLPQPRTSRDVSTQTDPIRPKVLSTHLEFWSIEPTGSSDCMCWLLDEDNCDDVEVQGSSESMLLDEENSNDVYVQGSSENMLVDEDDCNDVDVQDSSEYIVLDYEVLSDFSEQDDVDKSVDRLSSHCEPVETSAGIRSSLDEHTTYRGKKSDRRRHYCVLCDKLIMHFARHVTTIHGDEEALKDIMCLPPNDINRRELINKLRLTYDAQYNKKSSPADCIIGNIRAISSNKEIAPCPFCNKLLTRKYLFRHKCPHLNTTAGHYSGRQLQNLIRKNQLIATKQALGDRMNNGTLPKTCKKSQLLTVGNDKDGIVPAIDKPLHDLSSIIEKHSKDRPVNIRVDPTSEEYNVEQDWCTEVNIRVDPTSEEYNVEQDRCMEVNIRVDPTSEDNNVEQDRCTEVNIRVNPTSEEYNVEQDRCMEVNIRVDPTSEGYNVEQDRCKEVNIRLDPTAEEYNVEQDRCTEVNIRVDPTSEEYNVEQDRCTEVNIRVDPTSEEYNVEQDRCTEVNIRVDPTSEEYNVEQDRCTEVNIRVDPTSEEYNVEQDRCTEVNIRVDPTSEEYNVEQDRCKEVNIRVDPTSEEYNVEQDRCTEVNIRVDPTSEGYNVEQDRCKKVNIRLDPTAEEYNVEQDRCKEVNIRVDPTSEEFNVEQDRCAEVNIRVDPTSEEYNVKQNRCTDMEVGNNVALDLEQVQEITVADDNVLTTSSNLVESQQTSNDEDSSESSSSDDEGLSDFSDQDDVDKSVDRLSSHCEPVESSAGIRSSPDENTIYRGKKSDRRKHYCVLCDKLIIHFARHVTTIHGDEEALKDIICLPPKDRSRRELINKLRAKYDAQYNKKSFPADCIIGNIRAISSNKEIAACPFCKKLLTKKYLLRHKCPHLNTTAGHMLTVVNDKDGITLARDKPLYELSSIIEKHSKDSPVNIRIYPTSEENNVALDLERVQEITVADDNVLTTSSNLVESQQTSNDEDSSEFIASDDEGPSDFSEKDRGKKSDRRKHYCVLCDKLIMHFARHVTTIHGDEEAMKDIIGLPPNDKNRRELINKLRLKYDAQYNKKSSPADCIIGNVKALCSNKEIAPCPFCNKLLTRKYLFRHKCPHLNTTAGHYSGRQLQNLIRKNKLIATKQALGERTNNCSLPKTRNMSQLLRVVNDKDGITLARDIPLYELSSIIEKHSKDSPVNIRVDPTSEENNAQTSNDEELIEQSSPQKKKRKITYWSTPEKKAVKAAFGQHFVMETLPSRIECMDAQEKFQVLARRTPEVIKAYISNYFRKRRLN